MTPTKSVPTLESRMDSSDEALLRQLLLQIGSLSSKVDSIATSLDEKVLERRKHLELMEARFNGLESRVRSIELLGAEERTIPQAINDHESRLRALESIRWQLLGVAFVGSVLGNVLLKIL